MAATYDEDLPTNRDHVRFLIDDTDTSDANFSDAEIDAALADETATGAALKFYTAARLLEVLKVRYLKAGEGVEQKRVGKLMKQWGSGSTASEDAIQKRIGELRARGSWLLRNSSKSRVLRVF